MRLNLSTIAFAVCMTIGSAMAVLVATSSSSTSAYMAAFSVAPVWREATPQEEDEVWDYILYSPLGIAALNQLALEGFIGPTCDRFLCTHPEYGTFQTLLQIDCFTPRAIGARPYSGIRSIFDRFAGSIIDFTIERV